jgi:1-phosphofructokinase
MTPPAKPSPTVDSVILTLTANPSIDRTLTVERVERGRVIRAGAPQVDAGGKGVNVSRVLVRNGYQTLAVLPSGGAEGAQLQALLAEENVGLLPVRVGGAVRTNISLVEPDGTVTKINEPGPTLSEQEQETLLATTLMASRPGGWVAVCGSLPPGVNPDLYARLVVRLRQRGAKVALDTSDAPLELGLAAGPNLVKPNRDELSAVTGRSLRTLGDVIEAAKLVRDKGAEVVLVTLGADGALLVDDTGATHGEAPVAAPRSAVGAGDALLAGFLAAGGQGVHGLHQALCWGAAATALPGSRMPAPADLNGCGAVIHDRVDLDRILVDGYGGGVKAAAEP